MAASCLSPVGDATRTCSHQTSTKPTWWPQRDSNPCFSLERAVSWASRRWGRLNAWPEPTTNLLAGGGGFEPPLRGPEPRVLPLDDPPPTPQPYHTRTAPHASGARLNRQSADRGLEGAARAETRNFNSRNLDLRAGAGVAAVARGPARHHERPKTGNCYTPAAAQGLHDAADHRVHRAFCGGFRTSRVLGHDGHELGLRHPALRPSLSSAAGTTVSMTEDGEQRQAARA